MKKVCASLITIILLTGAVNILALNKLKQGPGQAAKPPVAQPKPPVVVNPPVVPPAAPTLDAATKQALDQAVDAMKAVKAAAAANPQIQKQVMDALRAAAA